MFNENTLQFLICYNCYLKILWVTWAADSDYVVDECYETDNLSLLRINLLFFQVLIFFYLDTFIQELVMKMPASIKVKYKVYTSE